MSEELGRHDRGVGDKSVLIVTLVRNRLSMFFEYASSDSQRLGFLYYLKIVLCPDVIKAVLRGSIFDKTAF